MPRDSYSAQTLLVRYRVVVGILLSFNALFLLLSALERSNKLFFLISSQTQWPLSTVNLKVEQ